MFCQMFKCSNFKCKFYEDCSIYSKIVHLFRSSFSREKIVLELEKNVHLI